MLCRYVSLESVTTVCCCLAVLAGGQQVVLLPSFKLDGYDTELQLVMLKTETELKAETVLGLSIDPVQWQQRGGQLKTKRSLTHIHFIMQHAAERPRRTRDIMHQYKKLDGSIISCIWPSVFTETPDILCSSSSAADSPKFITLGMYAEWH